MPASELIARGGGRSCRAGQRWRSAVVAGCRFWLPAADRQPPRILCRNPRAPRPANRITPDANSGGKLPTLCQTVLTGAVIDRVTVPSRPVPGPTGARVQTQRAIRRCWKCFGGTGWPASPSLQSLRPLHSLPAPTTAVLPRSGSTRNRSMLEELSRYLQGLPAAICGPRILRPTHCK